ncbi:MAG: GPR endopeptidase [Dysosmobacter sp.]|nr:GPR endopeptidase [Dysosmobacter sp.]
MLLFAKRTDLALEARELWQESAGKTTRLAGVKATKRKQEGYPVTRVDILDQRGEEALGKPRGTYLTVDLTTFWQRREDFFQRAVRAVGAPLKELVPTEGPVLVVGLGNRAMTPDAVGPLAADHVLVTRHLISAMPRQFSGFRPVSVLRTGVLGTTGVESAESVRGLAAEVKPACVIAVDALASRRTGRVCAAVQLSDTGIIPGSGVGNHRSPLNAGTLGVPVIAIGVPTVVDSATLAADLLEESGITDYDAEALQKSRQNLMVTPRDIDQQVRDLGKVIGYGINWALQDLEIDEMNALLS